jgi:hypothetical protein
MIDILNELIAKFKLSNDYTENKDIWVGHASIGEEGKPSIDEAKNFLSEKFNGCLADSGTKTPDWIIKTLEQWHDFHPFQNVREIDQPLFVKKLDDKKVVVAIMWPWQIKEQIASLMVYEGKMID